MRLEDRTQKLNLGNPSPKPKPQVIDLGVIAHPGSYLRDIWNLMDALVVICASISFVFDMT